MNARSSIPHIISQGGRAEIPPAFTFGRYEESSQSYYGLDSDPQRDHLPALLLLAIGRGDSVAHALVFLVESISLLLQDLDILVTLLQFLLELADFAELTSLTETGAGLAGSLASELLDLLLEAQSVEDHDICAVEDEREEKSETTEVHVALRVELASLDFHTLSSGDGASSSTLVLGLCKLDLHAVDSVHAVDEENEDEDEGDLQAVLQLRDDGVFAYESKELSLDGEGQWDDE